MKQLVAAIALTISAHAMANQTPLTAKELVAVKTAVNGQLKDPASAQYRNVRVSTKSAAVCGEVNAKNSLGGYTGFARFVLYLNPAFVVMDTEDKILEFHKAWLDACSNPEEDRAEQARLDQNDELCRDRIERGGSPSITCSKKLRDEWCATHGNASYVCNKP